MHRLALAVLLCTSAVAQRGFDSGRLEALRSDLASRGTKALLVLRNGQPVIEWYAQGHGAAKQHYSASLAKAIVGGSALILARVEGRISADDPVADYIPAWRDQEPKSKILIRHLATHTSGIEDAEQDGIPHMKLPGWKGAFWRRDPDPFTPALTEAPVLFPPGTAWHYSNPGMAALSYAITASLRGSAYTDLRSLLRARLFEPLGIPDTEWSIGYGTPYQVDGLRLYASWGGGSFTARAVARVGEWMRRLGEWNGRQLTPARTIAEALRDAGLPQSSDPHAPASGLCWYTNARGAWPALPPDAFAGAGAGHQLLLVVPSLGLVAVRNGNALEPELKDARFWGAAYDRFLAPLMGALADPPYPRSKIITGVRFDSIESIRRKAVGSDNWPLTWGADGHLYAAYGDGWGFTPGTGEKLSLGWARIEGGPEDFRGYNIRTQSGERRGDGRAGPKASGLLMLDGTLYAWVRNVANSQLIWSADKGVTWSWGFKWETGFGSPAFLNSGQDGRGAKDQFVYVYSQDGASAYDTSDAVVLARAPRSQLRDPRAWRFYSGTDPAGRPQWSPDLSQRSPVFEFPGHCERLDVVYHPGLNRYLLALGYNHSGGWGLFEAPDPWGPWSVAWHAHRWDLDGTHGYRLPAKWIGANGRMALVYSGTGREDAFCVRGMTLKLAREVQRIH